MGDESVQLRKIADIVKVCLQHAQEEKVQATQALKKSHEEIIEQHQSANKRRMISKKNLKKTEQRSKNRKSNCLQSI